MAGVGDRSAHNMAAPGPSSTLAPAVTVAGAVPLPRCDGIVDFSDYSLPLLGVSLVGLVIGLIYAFFGYRFFKSVLFLTGLLFGAGVIYLVC
uniref:DUF4203 domain-containing protein n=1 Tax=Plectus sambesii TaxID=2011161 RepID=A0A914V363_9BILA